MTYKLSKDKRSSVKKIAEDVLKILPLHIRCEIEENNQREDYSTKELAEIQETVTKYIKKQFRPGRKFKKGSKKGEKCQPVVTLKSLSFDRVDDIVGWMTNKESGETVRIRRNVTNYVKSNQESFPNLLEDIDKKRTSLKYANNMIKRVQLKDNPSPPPPEGKYEVIYIDPPWEYDFPLQGAPPYKTMTLEELKQLKIPAAENCVIFMWVTNPKLKDGIELLESWGFTYKTKMTWVKEKDGKLQMTTGYYTRGADESLLIGIKGNPGVPFEKDRPPSVIHAPRTIHSRKPRIFARKIEEMYAGRKKIEMFAREKDPDDDGTWTYWGDELEEQS